MSPKKYGKPIIGRPRKNNYESFRDLVKDLYTGMTGKPWTEKDEKETRAKWDARQVNK